MIATRTQPVMLLQHDLALTAYLEALLATVPDDTALETQAEAIVAAPPQPEIVSEITVTVAAEPVAETAAPAEEPAPPISEEFHALFFRVGDITLATPVLDLRRIVDFDPAITALPNQPSWLLGLLENQGEKIGIMHTAELLQGQEKIQCRDFDAQPYRKILIARQGRYGFACDEVLEMVKLRPEDVRWRSAPQDSRTWLIGTVLGRLSVLVDLAALTPIRR